jgi:hypothetical protein
MEIHEEMGHPNEAFKLKMGPASQKEASRLTVSCELEDAVSWPKMEKSATTRQ